MTTADLLLVRHGATAHTAQRRFSGCTGTNPPLSALGERQAALLAARLADRFGDSGGVDAVVTSPMARAHRTAEVVAAACGTALQVEDDLREIDFGGWEGRTAPEIEIRHPGALAAWRADPSSTPPGGESVDAVAARVDAVRRRLAGRRPGGVVVLVSHLYPVRVSVLDALGAPYVSAHRIELEPTSITEVRATGHGLTALVRHNDTAHLASSPVPAQRGDAPPERGGSRQPTAGGR
jgi:probable phosphoglycerate mutase